MSQMKAGAILSYLSLFVTGIIALVYTPILIRLIGQNEYGLYALIGSMAAYFSIMDLGLGNTIIRYIARNKAIGTKKIESELNGFFLKIYAYIGLLAAIVGIIVWLNIEVIFGNSLTTTELEKAKLMIIILIFNFALSFPLSIFSSILQAYERFVFVKMVAIFRALLIPIVTIPFLLLEHGAVTMLVITTVVNISVLIYSGWVALTKLDIHFSFGKFEREFIKEIFGFSFFIFLNVIVDLIYWNTDQFILGITSGTDIVAVYAIAMQFIMMYKMFSTSISNLFLPKTSKLVANNASDLELSKLMVKYGRIQYLILIFILSGFSVFGYQFIITWAGESYKTAYFIVLIIMFPLTIPLSQNFGIAVLQAKNIQGFRAITYLIIAIINIIISIPLAINYGGIGIAIATTLSLIIGHIILMNIYYHTKIKINMILYWKNILQITIAVIILTTIVFGIDRFFFDSSHIIILLIRIVIFTLVFLAVSWIFVLNDYEKNLFKSIIKKQKINI
ncbi:oligosaccharide flippase family protein [Oceanobacillus massiliensis]|uniref:oligosaccharide flippase family protein n=1 Tax=Oceanobacillus massiliensis TaxID=1465765 RepID=UPI000289A9A1|nr:oligosaccharide flippase family protein [Oceanobacillus massiliensis]